MSTARRASAHHILVLIVFSGEHLGVPCVFQWAPIDFILVRFRPNALPAAHAVFEVSARVAAAGVVERASEASASVAVGKAHRGVALCRRGSGRAPTRVSTRASPPFTNSGTDRVGRGCSRRGSLLAGAPMRVAGAGMVESWSRWKLADGYTAVCANADCGLWAAAERIR